MAPPSSGLIAWFSSADVDGAGNGNRDYPDGRQVLTWKNLGGGQRAIGPFPPDVYNDTNGKARVQFTSVASVTAAVVRF